MASPNQSKVDDLFYKGWNSYVKSFEEPDRKGMHLSKAHGYLSMAHKEAGNDVEEKKGIAGTMALVLVYTEDYKNAETWALQEFAINPTHLFAKLAWYWIELDKLVNHHGFVMENDGSWTGLFSNLITSGVDRGRVESKMNAVRKAAVDAAKALQDKARTEPDPSPYTWVISSFMLLEIIDNMWANNMKEPYLCETLLNLPWDRFSEQEISGGEDMIEEIQVTAQGYLSRLR
jgi:hypothetical protein